jgi:hypothetical protein
MHHHGTGNKAISVAVPWSLLATPDQFFSQRQERAGTGTSERAGTPNC